MRLDRPPYWYWGLDRWNILVSVALLAAVLVTGMSTSAPQPAATPTPVASPTATAVGPTVQATPTPVAPSPTATVPPPTFAGLAEGAQLVGGVSTLSGTAPSGAPVKLFADGQLIGETVAGPDGKPYKARQVVFQTHLVDADPTSAGVRVAAVVEDNA
ncbi:MAG: hypothetical protein WHX53_16420, partial [Anaerolineae bacterium]